MELPIHSEIHQLTISNFKNEFKELDHSNMSDEFEKKISDVVWYEDYFRLITNDWEDVYSQNFINYINISVISISINYLLTRGWFIRSKILQQKLVVLVLLGLGNHVTGFLYGDFKLETNWLLYSFQKQKISNLWKRFRNFVLIERPICIFLLKITQEHICDVNGSGRINDLESFRNLQLN